MIAFHDTLVPHVVTQVTLDMRSKYWILITNRTLSGEIFVTLDGTTPSILGADTHLVILGRSFRSTDSSVVISQLGFVTVNLISAAALEFSVEAVD